MTADQLDLKIQTLEAMYALGWNPILVAANGTKQPIGKWELYQDHRRPLADLIAELRKKPKVGIGVLPGKVFDDRNKAITGRYLVMIEFERMEDLETCKTAADVAGYSELFERLGGCGEFTPGGGVHAYGYLPLAVRNEKLAERVTEDGEIKTVAETRGVGGFSITAPSGGSVHPSGKPYVAFGDLAATPELTLDEWAQLVGLIGSVLDERKKSRQQRRYNERKRAKSERSYLRPGDDFNQRASWHDVLEPHGWTAIDETKWNRPGAKNRGKHDATVDVDENGIEWLTVWSTSTAFATETPYDKFGAYTLLNCGGDFSNAASELRANGYGTLPTMTLYGLAELFADQHGDSVRYIAEGSGWHVWDGRRWVLDTLGYVRELMKSTVRALLALAISETDDDKRKKLVQFALSCQTNAKTSDALKLAETMPEIAATLSEFDTDPLLFNVANGTLNLATGDLQPHDPANHITKLANVAYDPNATAPRFEAAVTDALGPELAGYLYEIIGYMLSGLTFEKAYWLVLGSTDTGKSSIVNAMLALLGEYAISPHESKIAKSKHRDADPTDLADFPGARAVIVSETSAGMAQNSGLIKALTGRNRLEARRLYSSAFAFTPTAKLLVESNHAPIADSRDDAIFRRCKIIPFPKPIPLEKQISNFDEVLIGELSGILNIALEGFKRYQSAGNKLTEPAIVRDAVQAYRRDLNPLSNFIAECCDLSPHAKTPQADLWRAYEQWAENAGIHMPLRKPDVYAYLKQIDGVIPGKGGKNVAIFEGIALHPDATTGPRLFSADNPFDGRKAG